MEHQNTGSVTDMLLQWELLLALLVPVFCQNLTVDDYKLPSVIDSLLYNLTLDPNLDALTFDGNLIFTFRPLKNVPVLILNCKNLLIDTFQVFTEDEFGTVIKVSLAEDKDLERLIITPLDYFRKGRIYSINFKYQGNITEDGTGLYRSSYIDNGVKQWMLVSQMRPVHTRKVFPCFDEPSFRARFSLSVWHNKDYFAVSNMPPIFTEEFENRVLTVFEESPAIPVFLTGLLISKLSSVNGERRFTSLAIPEEVPAVAYSAEIGPKLVAAMEAQLSIEYPQTKTHQVALPRLVPVAMENWGLFNFRRENILYSPDVSPTVQKQTVARFSGHEVSHAWLGNSVTIAWWDYLWLSEMFAMYLEYYLPNLVHPEWRMDEQMAIDLAFAGLEGDSPSADPLTTAVLTPSQISAKFSGLTYTKGPGLLRMVQHVLTFPNFFNGIKNYLEIYWGRSVTPSDLWNSLEEQGTFPTKMEDIMSRWTDQPGYPLVTVSLNPEDGSAVLQQKPFSIDDNNRVNTSWWIPISTLSSKDKYLDTRPKFWLAPGQAFSFPVSGDWVLFNVDGSGFFRTSYPPEMFSRLSLQLHSDHLKIPPLSRARLVDDAVWLSRAGLLDIHHTLGLVSYLASELDFIVWKSAVRSLEVLGSLLHNSKIYPLYKSYVLFLLDNIFTTRGLIDAPYDTHVDKVQREIIVSLSCRMDNPNCIRASIDHINALIAGSKYRISPDTQTAIFCTAVSNGGNKAWEFAFSLYINNPKESFQYLAALACTSDIEKIKLFLIESISVLNEEKWMERFSAMASRKENADALLNILHQNINIIINKYGTQTLSRALLKFTNYLTTKKQSDVLQDIQRLGVGGLAIAITQIENRAVWLEKNIPLILNYFKSNLQFNLITS